MEYNPISILYTFQIDISSNSREIKYQNIGRTHRYTDRHTHRQTNRQTDRVKTIPRNPLPGRGNHTNMGYKFKSNEQNGAQEDSAGEEYGVEPDSSGEWGVQIQGGGGCYHRAYLIWPI